MKIEDWKGTGLLAAGALGIAGLAAGVALGLAAGIAYGRDPESLRQAARRAAGQAARGLEHAMLVASQAREQLGDLWAEAREGAVAAVDAADFERAAGAAATAGKAAGGKARTGAGRAAATRRSAGVSARTGKARAKRASAPTEVAPEN